jgi:hypothetical protein
MMKKNKSASLLLVSAFLAFACGGGDKQMNEMTETVVEESGWESLFDGKTFEGWSKYGGGEVGNAWKVQDGAIYLDAKNKDGWQTGDGGDIVPMRSLKITISK